MDLNVGWLNDFMPSLTFGGAMTHDNLSLVPIFGPESGPPLITLDQGLGEGVVEITEVSESGSVPTLQVHNHGTEMLLLFDGEELVGAKQNRVLNTSILVEAGSSVLIPVSCVEQGRWAWRSKHFHSEGRVMKQGMRRSKAARMSTSLSEEPAMYDAGQATVWREVADHAHAGQATVWREVAEHARRRGTFSDTGAMADVYDADKSSIEDFLAAFPAADGQVGVAAYVNGELVGIDILGRPEVYASLHPKLLRALAAEAIDWSDGPARPDSKKPDEVLQRLRESRRFEATPPGVGRDVRFEGPDLHAAALVVPEGPVHLAIFPC